PSGGGRRVGCGGELALERAEVCEDVFAARARSQPLLEVRVAEQLQRPGEGEEMAAQRAREDDADDPGVMPVRVAEVDGCVERRDEEPLLREPELVGDDRAGER